MTECRRVWSRYMQGACTTLLSLRVYYIACPSVLVNFANFTETPAGPEMTSIVPRDGACVPHADVGDQRPSYLCKADGSWYYATGSCKCRPGYQPHDDAGTGCTRKNHLFIYLAGQKVSVCLSVCLSFLLSSYAFSTSVRSFVTNLVNTIF